MATNEVEILIKAVDKASSELKKISGSAGGLEKETKTLGDTWKGMATKIGLAVGVVAAAGAAFKKAMDLGKEGAAALQTAESFELLLKKVGAAPDLLDDLKEASKGTITELDLMSSTAALLAGTQGELATNLANSTPELMKIAKAASKLNPALGDTTHMYESLALGIKRASPMILDNLGLTIKVSEANEAYAKSVGKTVEELTAEELKIALLNEVLRAGDVLVDQVGGSTDSMTDSFERLEVATTELKTAIGEKLAPTMAGIAEEIAGAITYEKDLSKALKDTTGSYEDYVKQLDKYVTSSGYGIQTTAEAQFAQEMLTEEAYEAIQANEDLTSAAEDLRHRGYKPVYDITKILKEETEELTDATEDAKAAEDELREAAERVKNQLSELKEVISGTVTKAYDDFIEKNEDLTKKGEALRAKIEELEGKEYLTDEQAAQLAEARSDYAENQEALEELTKAHEDSSARIIFGYYEQGLARDGLTETELQALTDIGVALGIYDETTAQTMKDVQQSVQNFNESGQMDEIINDAIAIKGAIEDIPTYKESIVKIFHTTYYEEVQSTTYGNKRQHGGPVRAGQEYLVGERGPEMFIPMQSGMIIPNHQVYNTTNINLTGNYAYQSESSILQDARLLEMMYG